MAKRFARRLAFVLGVSLAGGYGADYVVGTKSVTNATYCTLRELVKPDGAKERTTLDLCVAAEPLSLEEQVILLLAMEDAKRRYADEFNIDIKVSEYLDLPEQGAVLDIDGLHERVKGGQQAPSHARMLFLRDDYGRGATNWAGLTNQGTNTVYIDSLADTDVLTLSQVIQHEIGHLYYAKHEDKPWCVMYPRIPDELPASWCPESRSTILKYKHRIW